MVGLALGFAMGLFFGESMGVLSVAGDVDRLAVNITGGGNGFTFSNALALDITTVQGNFPVRGVLVHERR